MAHQRLIVGAVHAAGLVVLGAVLAGAAIADRPVADFTREPVRAMLRTSCEGATCSAIGALSTLGVLVWAAGATVCFVVAWLERGRSRGARVTAFFFCAGLLTLALMLDDAFAVHESLAYLVSPYAEELMFALYGLAGVGLLVAFRSFIVRTSFLLLLGAGALFAVSVAFDRVLPPSVLAEDAAKWIAILAWSTYFVTTGLAVVDSGRHARAGAVEGPAG